MSPDKMIEHTPPMDFPKAHFIGLEIPADFAKVVAEAAAKNGALFADQLLTWAQMGAEHSRLCKAQETRGAGRKRK